MPGSSMRLAPSGTCGCGVPRLPTPAMRPSVITTTGSSTTLPARTSTTMCAAVTTTVSAAAGAFASKSPNPTINGFIMDVSLLAVT